MSNIKALDLDTLVKQELDNSNFYEGDDIPEEHIPELLKKNYPINTVENNPNKKIICPLIILDDILNCHNPKSLDLWTNMTNPNHKDFVLDGSKTWAEIEEIVKTNYNIEFIKENIDKFIKLIDNDNALSQMIIDILEVDSIKDNLEQLYEYLKTDKSLNEMIIDMINNKEYEKKKLFKKYI